MTSITLLKFRIKYYLLYLFHLFLILTTMRREANILRSKKTIPLWSMTNIGLKYTGKWDLIFMNFIQKMKKNFREFCKILSHFCYNISLSQTMWQNGHKICEKIERKKEWKLCDWSNVQTEIFTTKSCLLLKEEDRKQE